MVDVLVYNINFKAETQNRNTHKTGLSATYASLLEGFILFLSEAI
jgi:hypothetical protein